MEVGSSAEWEAARAAHLVETAWLDEQIRSGDPRLRIVDMRGSVQTQTISEGVQSAVYLGAAGAYAAGHIPGAVYLDWTRDIVNEADPVAAQLAPPDKMKRVLEAAGIGDEHLIVAYDSHAAGQFAARFWWAMRYYGHSNVRVLNGGWAKWTREDRPVTSEIPQYPPARFTPRPEPQWRAGAEQMQAWIGRPDVQILDARDADQYTGRIRRGARGGHIPGALHLPREALFAPEGTFRSPEEMQTILAAAGVRPEAHVVAYCNGGVAATSVLFALSMLGFPRLSNYDGSWNEWAERPELPVER